MAFDDLLNTIRRIGPEGLTDYLNNLTPEYSKKATDRFARIVDAAQQGKKITESGSKFANRLASDIEAATGSGIQKANPVPFLKAAGVAGSALSLPEQYKQLEQSESDILSDDTSTLKKAAESLKALGTSAQIASGPLSLANPVVGIGTGVVGTGANLVGELGSNVDENINKLNDLQKRFTKEDLESLKRPMATTLRDRKLNDASRLYEMSKMSPNDTSQIDRTNKFADEAYKQGFGPIPRNDIKQDEKKDIQTVENNDIPDLEVPEEAETSEQMASSEQPETPVKKEFKIPLELLQQTREPASNYDKSDIANIMRALEIMGTGIAGLGSGQGPTKPIMQEYYKDIVNQEQNKDLIEAKKQQEQISRLAKKQDREAALDLRKIATYGRVEQQINTLFDRNTKDEVARIQAADRVEALINAIENGILVDSTNIRKTLTNDLSILALPVGTRGTLADREKQSINTLSTKAKDIISWVTNKPNKTIPPQYAKQLKDETRILKDKYRHALDQKAKSLLKGTIKDSDNADIKKQIIHGRMSEFLPEKYGDNITEQTENKIVIKKGYNPKTNQTQLIYSDGSKEIVEGRQ